jgi:predicted dehydrogenase
VRKIRVFQEDAYLSLDYQKQAGVMYRLQDSPKGKEIVRDKVEIQRGEPLKIELEAFVHCALDGAKPKVSGHEAADALEIALEITRRIEEADPRKKANLHPS